MSYTVKKIIPFSKISKETLATIQKLDKENNDSINFCYAYDSDAEFVFYFFLVEFLFFPLLFFMGNISLYEISIILLATLLYLGNYWGRHYRYETEPCVFCDNQYIGYFSFRRLLLYRLIDDDGDATIRKIEHVSSLDYEGLIIKFITGEQVKIYAKEDLSKYKKILQSIQYRNFKSSLSEDSIKYGNTWYKDTSIYDLLYLGTILFFALKGIF